MRLTNSVGRYPINLTGYTTLELPAALSATRPEKASSTSCPPSNPSALGVRHVTQEVRDHPWALLRISRSSAEFSRDARGERASCSPPNSSMTSSVEEIATPMLRSSASPRS